MNVAGVGGRTNSNLTKRARVPLAIVETLARDVLRTGMCLACCYPVTAYSPPRLVTPGGCVSPHCTACEEATRPAVEASVVFVCVCWVQACCLRRGRL
jgi:hypothetical protein